MNNFWKLVLAGFVLYFVASNPTGAAAIGEKTWGFVTAAADGVGQALTALFS